MQFFIYKLERIKPAGYDEYNGFIVIAPTEKDARGVVRDKFNRERERKVWIDWEQSMITMLGTLCEDKVEHYEWTAEYLEAQGDPIGFIEYESYRAG